MPRLVIDPYLSRYTPSLRVPLYYLTWTLYYLSFVVSPGCLTLVQLLVMFVEHLIPRVETWIERDVRERLKTCLWAQQSWKSGGGRGRGRGRGPVTTTTPSRSNSFGGGGGGVWNWIASWTSPQKPVQQQQQQRDSRVPPRNSAFVPLRTEPNDEFQRSKPPVPSYSRPLHAGRLGGGGSGAGGSSSMILPSSLDNGSIDRFYSSPGSTRGGQLLRSRQFRGIGGSGTNRRLPFQLDDDPSPDLNLDDDDDEEGRRHERGSVWSGNGWIEAA